jgi:hypothetical protein
MGEKSTNLVTLVGFFVVVKERDRSRSLSKVARTLNTISLLIIFCLFLNSSVHFLKFISLSINFDWLDK